MGDHYDKTKSQLGNSSLTPAATQANATTTPEFPTCDSDIYLAYEQMPTREIMAAIIGAGLTPDATDLTQLFQAMQALIAAAVPVELEAQGTIVAGTSGTNEKFGSLTLTLPALRKWTKVTVYTTVVINSGSATEWKSLKANGVIQSPFTNTPIGGLYNSSSSDAQLCINQTLGYTPSALTSNQAIENFWTWSGTSQTAAAMWAVGKHVKA